MSQQAQTPQPMSFAILRNTHEVLRRSITLMGELLDKGSVEAFRQEWRNYRRCRSTHVSMEDGSVFSLLDEISGGMITGAGLQDEHVEDEVNAKRVEQAETGSELKAAFTNWEKFQLDHLNHEEKVMGPLTMKTAPTPEGRGRVVQQHLLLPAIAHGDFDWYLAFVIKRLTAYGTAQQPPNVGVRVFAWGLQHASTPAQWQQWKKIVRENTSEAIWLEMVEQFQIDGEGKITDQV